MITDDTIIDAYIDAAGEMKEMRKLLSLSTREVLEAIQRPTVRQCLDQLAAELERTSEFREALTLKKLAESLQPALEAATDPSLRCRIVNTLIRAVKGSPRRAGSRTPGQSSSQLAAQRITHPPTQPTALPVGLPSTTQQEAPITSFPRAPQVANPTESAVTQSTTNLVAAPTRPPFMNRAARRAAKQSVIQTTNQPALHQSIHRTRHAA